MPAPAPAAISSFQVISFGENNHAVLNIIIRSGTGSMHRVLFLIFFHVETVPEDRYSETTERTKL
jgi:hypothetical protein